jgi:hypothetical protein
LYTPPTQEISEVLSRGSARLGSVRFAKYRPQSASATFTPLDSISVVIPTEARAFRANQGSLFD